MLAGEPLDVSKVEKLDDRPGITTEKMPAIAEAGVLLTKIVLAMVMASIVLLFAYLFIADRQNSAALQGVYDSIAHQATIDTDRPDAAHPNVEKLRALTEFAKEVNEHRQSFRAFWLQLAQLLLLNLLLPLLTALLGYIFGTTRISRTE